MCRVSNKELPMQKKAKEALSRRERQIMDILYLKTNATVAEVLEELPDPPSYSAVRALLRILEIKGHVKHRSEGPRYIFAPVISREKAKRSALEHLLKTFFNGSTEKAVASLIDVSKDHLSDEQLDRLSRLIDEVKMEGR